jgi:hypothetical protein
MVAVAWAGVRVSGEDFWVARDDHQAVDDLEVKVLGARGALNFEFLA